jgi:signal transduction histidine kinase
MKIHLYPAYSAQPLRAGRRAGALSLLSASDAPAGHGADGLYRHFTRVSGFYLDAPALAGHAETGIRRAAFWRGHFTERIHFDSGSSFERLGVAFNQMADNINALIASKKQLIDGIAHELRTPLVRLRYRLEMSENLTEAESQALNRDIGQLEGAD